MLLEIGSRLAYKMYLTPVSFQCSVKCKRLGDRKFLQRNYFDARKSKIAPNKQGVSLELPISDEVVKYTVSISPIQCEWTRTYELCQM